uniref:Sulfate transporter CysZ n=1 Tax=Candidatus Kentrum sp. TUN TaxID=2126343 RepID=A0A451AV17_9GAMM|nr:MAG: CysZ protein [Candidatus Kentron sp. TUN]VFK60782.1 MAG: CysZ protein [Candidatus Kentron sp. TUN]VFK69899.1 MAG: CysZ protein [Candidatus Kentron sp. TUN]
MRFGIAPRIEKCRKGFRDITYLSEGADAPLSDFAQENHRFMKSHLHDLSTGSGYFWRGFSLLNQPGIRRYVVMPLFINTVLFATLIYFGAEQFDGLLDGLIPDWLNWLRWLLWPLFAILALFVVFFLFSWIGNLVAAPFNSLLSEAIHAKLTGETSSQNTGWAAFIGDIAKSIIPALLSELYKLQYLILRAVPLGLLFLIPGINVVAPFLWLAFGAWMLAMEYADYPMGNHGLSFPEQRKHLRERRSLSFGFGFMVLLATMLPGLNFLVIPTAVAGATAMWVEQYPDV